MHMGDDHSCEVGFEEGGRKLIVLHLLNLGFLCGVQDNRNIDGVNAVAVVMAKGVDELLQVAILEQCAA